MNKATGERKKYNLLYPKNSVNKHINYSYPVKKKIKKLKN